MPFHSQHSSQNVPNPASGIFQAAGSLGAIAAPNLQRLASSNNTALTSAGTDTLSFATPAHLAQQHGSGVNGSALSNGGLVQGMAAPGQQIGGRAGGGYEGGQAQQQLPMSAPVSTMPNESQQFGTPRRQHTTRMSEDFRFGQPLTPQQQQGAFGDVGNSAGYPASAAPAFNLQQATPNQQPGGVVLPSNVPGSLQPAGGAQRPGPLTSANTAPAIPTIQSQPIQSNMQQYTQPNPPSRQNTMHSHSRSSPAGMDGSSMNSVNSKYIPFNQTPTQTPTASRDGRSFNTLSPQTPYGAASHSPLNLTDIRSHALSESETSMSGLGPNATFKYSTTATNSNYLAPFSTYAYDWCKWPVLSPNTNSAGKMAVGSYLEDPHNFIQILDTHIVHQEGAPPGQPQYGLEYTKLAEATCAYPVTRILWEPPSSQKSSTDLLATSGDHLRLWSLPPAEQRSQMNSNTINRTASANTRDQGPLKLQPLALLSNSKTPEHTAPLTSLDWNTLSPKLIITSSIDTTCTIWDIPTLTAKTQLIAHDKEVFDVRFCAGSVDVFVSCGADGSVRMFDLRSLEHSTIIYEPAEKEPKGASPTSPSPTKTAAGHTLTPAPPLLRLAASPHDAHLLATFASDSNLIRILDVRQPGTALLELRGHSGSLNTIEWNPNRRGMLASGADDSLVLVWDLMTAGGQVAAPMNGAVGNGSTAQTASGGAQAEVQGKGPTASWKCEYEVGNVSWAPQSALTGQGGDWLGVCAGRGVWGVKI